MIPVTEMMSAISADGREDLGTGAKTGKTGNSLPPGERHVILRSIPFIFRGTGVDKG